MAKPINRNRRVPNSRFVNQADNILFTLRERLGMTQSELAREIGASVISVGLYEMGKQIPVAYTAKKYQKVLAEHGIDITLDEFYRHIMVTDSYTRFRPREGSMWDNRDYQGE